MTKEEGEKWIVNLIRDTRADAKIDFKQVSISSRNIPAHLSSCMHAYLLAEHGAHEPNTPARVSIGD